MLGVGSLDGAEQAGAVLVVERREAVVAQHHVLAGVGPGVDVVPTLAAKHHVGAVADDDHVDAAGLRR